MIDREFFLGFVRTHILYHATKEAVFGTEIAKELARHGYEISPGTLYPILHRLEAAGYMERSAEVVGGKIRKYYRATPKGRRVLEDTKRKIGELVKEILEER